MGRVVFFALVCSVVSATLTAAGDVEYPWPVEARSRQSSRPTLDRSCPPDGTTCVPLGRCPQLLRLLDRPTRKKMRKLKRSTCRIQNRYPFVCCQNPMPERPPPQQPTEESRHSPSRSKASAPQQPPAEASSQEPPTRDAAEQAVPAATPSPAPERTTSAAPAVHKTTRASVQSTSTWATPRPAPHRTTSATPAEQITTTAMVQSTSTRATPRPASQRTTPAAHAVHKTTRARVQSTSTRPTPRPASQRTTSAAPAVQTTTRASVQSTSTEATTPGVAATLPATEATSSTAEPVPDSSAESDLSLTNRFESSAHTDEPEYDDEDYHEPPASEGATAGAGECGYGSLSVRIIGGVEVAPGAWPWTAVLGYTFHESMPDVMNWACGAALIGPRHVLTAAHCVVSETPAGRTVVTDLKKVRLGEHDLYDDTDGPVVDVTPSNILIHENYTGRPTYSNDIAIIELETAVNYTENISPVCLPGVLRSHLPVELSAASETPDNKLVVAGWGSDGIRLGTARLMEVSVSPIRHTQCKKHFGAFKIPIVESRQMCAGGKGKDSCSGDSGGPLVQETETGQYELVGVVSLGGVVCGGEIPGLYTRVQAYMDWIIRTTAQ